MLVIAPSKTDRERVIPDVRRALRRHRSDHPPPHAEGPRDPRGVPATTRTSGKPWPTRCPTYSSAARARRPGRDAHAGTVVRLPAADLRADLRADPAFSGLVFTPHDFRRLFATELVNSGLPIHIGAALLGHLSLETTRGYVAVFDDEIVRHYQAVPPT